MKKRTAKPKTAAPEPLSVTPRGSFLPETPGQPPPIVASAKLIAPEGDRDDSINLRVTRIDDRTIELELTISPLQPCVERVFLPSEPTPFRLASIMASAIGRASKSAEMDGIVQQAKRENEDEETRQRIAGRA